MIGKRGLGIVGVLLAVAGLGVASGAQAQPIVGVPHDWQVGFPASYTPLMDRVESLNDLLLVIISLICAFVLALLLYAMWRFHASRNPVPTATRQPTRLSRSRSPAISGTGATSIPTRATSRSTAAS